MQPVAAVACPVCFSAANGRVLEMYYLTAALMTLLPLAVLGTVAVWLRHRFNAAEGRTAHGAQRNTPK